MFPHDELVPLVGRMGLAGFFDRIDGLRGAPGDEKAAYLEAHLRELIADISPSDVLVVGDTPDDARAASHVGARCVLYHNGSHHRGDLESVGVPVVDSLVAAVSVV
jgi:phosphoglycolate phosphatase-like HAD superfamily hydrolase